MKLNTFYTNAASNYSPYVPTYLESSETAYNNLLHLTAFGELYATNPFFCSISGLPSYCLLYTLEGKGTLTTNEGTYTLDPHKIAYYYCNNKHDIQIKQSTSWKFQQYFFTGPNADLYYKEYISDHTITSDITAISNIPKYMDELSLQYNNHSFSSELSVAMLLTDILTELTLQNRTILSTAQNIPSYLLKIKQQLEANFHQDISLDQLAEQYNKNKYRIIRDFTNYLNDTPINYLIKCRIRVAKELLTSTDLSITMISYQIGIENVTHFINLFKKETGVTPLNYRKEHPPHIN